MNKTTVKKGLGDSIVWLIGCILYAVAVHGFALPNSIAQSGITGAAVIFHKLFDLPVGLVGFILNLPLLVLMVIFLGKSSFIKTLCVTGILAAALDFVAVMFDKFIPVYTGDHILASFVCGFLQGAGLGMIMTTSATSGGTDIVGRLIHAKWPHISVGRIIMVADAVVVIANMIVFRSFESGLYAIIVAFTSTKVIDSLLYGMGSGKMLMVFTSKADEVANALISSSRRGVSILPAVGAYSREEKHMLICVARKNEISDLIKIVKSVDEGTFIIISEANEILGKGFAHSI